MKKIISKIKFLGLSVKREFIILGIADFLFLAISAVCGILLKNLLFLAFGAGIAVVFTIFYFSRYGSRIDKIDNDNLKEFCYLFGFFRIYIKNGYNVYNALKEISNFASENLKNFLDELLSEIDNDKSLQPFVNFSKNFKEILVEEIMISIYQMIDDGEQSNYLNQFELIFDKFSEVMNEQNLRNKDKNLGTLSAAPLVGSCFLIITITVGIVSVLGEVINGV